MEFLSINFGFPKISLENLETESGKLQVVLRPLYHELGSPQCLQQAYCVSGMVHEAHESLKSSSYF